MMDIRNFQTRSVNSMRAGWTLIELIFVIIIIAILGSIAIKSLSVTRDDAKLSADVSNMNVCLKDMNNILGATQDIQQQLYVSVNSNNIERLSQILLSYPSSSISVSPIVVSGSVAYLLGPNVAC